MTQAYFYVLLNNILLNKMLNRHSLLPRKNNPIRSFLSPSACHPRVCGDPVLSGGVPKQDLLLASRGNFTFNSSRNSFALDPRIREDDKRRSNIYRAIMHIR